MTNEPKVREVSLCECGRKKLPHLPKCLPCMKAEKAAKRQEAPPPPVPQEACPVEKAPPSPEVKKSIKIFTNPYGDKPGTIITPEQTHLYERYLPHVLRKDRCGGAILAIFV